MKKLKLFASILSVILVSYSYAQIGIAGKPDDFILKVGYFEFPGITYTDDKGKPAGLVNDITIKTLENAKIRYSIQAYSAARLFEGFSKGEIHFFNGVSTITAIQQSAFSGKIPLFELEMRVYKIGDKPTISKKEDLAGHSVILIRGFSYNDWGAWLRDEKNKVKVVEPYKHESSFEMLKQGRAEYLLTYKYIDDDVLKKIRIADLIAKPLFKLNCSFNINKTTPDAEALLKKIEDSYQQLIQEGRIKKYE